MSKFFLKKTWVNVDVCVEDYYNSGTTLEHTVEEIDEDTFKSKLEKSNTTKDSNKKVSLEDCKVD